MIHAINRKTLSRYRQLVKDLQAQRQFLESSLLGREPLVEGCLVVVRKVCGNAGCRCAKSKKERHGPFLYLSILRKGKTKTIHLPKEWEQTVKTGVEAARRYRKARQQCRVLGKRLDNLWRQIERQRKHLPYEPKQKSR
ncbi:MAG: DUF6788 family protein [Nitrospirota bacterium]